MVVVHVAAFRPVGGVGGRSFETVHDTGLAPLDQPDLRLKTASRLARPIVTIRHDPSKITYDGL